jgi:hypothetical protein
VHVLVQLLLVTLAQIELLVVTLAQVDVAWDTVRQP